MWTGQTSTEGDFIVVVAHSPCMRGLTWVWITFGSTHLWTSLNGLGWVGWVTRFHGYTNASSM